jgi:ribonuclease J
VQAIAGARLFEEQLAAEPHRCVTAFSLQSARRFADAGCLAGAAAIWSMWTGYLGEPSGVKLQSFLSEHGIPLLVHHTSGHAPTKDLQRLARAIAPGPVVPIHSFGSERFGDYFDQVSAEPDLTWGEV